MAGVSVAPAKAEYHALLEAEPRLGVVGRLPWDEAIFGFPVAELKFGGAPRLGMETAPKLKAALDDYCRKTGAELVSVRTAAADIAAQSALIAAGFVPVDFSLLAQISPLRLERLPKSRVPIRLAAPGDFDAVCGIAYSAFEFGRYHTDPRFPRDLANLRFQQWAAGALEGHDPDDRILVLGRPGAVLGFMHVAVRDGRADLRLGAVDPANDMGFAGFSLYAETLRAVHRMGARGVSAKISAANTRVLNVCAMLGFRFSDPESALHWHAPRAAHLRVPSSGHGERSRA